MRVSDAPVFVQITDLHISAQQDENAQRLKAIIQIINENIHPILILITGDLVHNGLEVKSYEYLRSLLEQLKAPYYLIPGNHDDRFTLKKVFYDMPYIDNTVEKIEYIINLPNLPFALLALDTVIPGKFYGQLSNDQIQKIGEVCRTILKPLALFMHHPLLTETAINSFASEYYPVSLLEALQFIGVESFASKIPSFSSLKIILSGHFHMAAQMEWQGVSLIIAPSIAPPLKSALPHRDHLARMGIILNKNPGFAVHSWDKNSNNFISSFHYSDISS